MWRWRWFTPSTELSFRNDPRFRAEVDKVKADLDAALRRKAEARPSAAETPATDPAEGSKNPSFGARSGG